MLIRLNWSEKKNRPLILRNLHLHLKVYKIYNKSHKCDAHHVFMIFYYSFYDMSPQLNGSLISLPAQEIISIYIEYGEI